jgi:diguanylate cyclase (GGDEF)-like protein
VAGGSIIVRRMRLTAGELKASEAQAQHNSLHDAMTGLPNRVYYMQRLRSQLAACCEGKVCGNLFVTYIDIDGFKLVNDTLGHHVGDELVRQIASRLRGALPQGDFLARFGGDEFVLMRCGEGGAAAADALGSEIMRLMRAPFVISGNTLDISVSCGISWGPEQSEDPGELLRRADIALYRAKQRGRGRYRRFTLDMDASVKLRREMEMELRLAITRGELSVAYQPVVETGTGTISGFEALLRWNHPERGDIRPGLFVPIAEQGGLMIPLGTWVLRHVFTECRDWPPCDISINLSPLQIMASDFLPTLAGLIAETGIDPDRIVFEVTEGVMLDRSAHVIKVLRELNRMGIRVALDDFGIGYSSLSYLRSFQFDRIKIDRSFVHNIERDRDAHAILCAIVALGHTLRMKVVAEGVETEVQRLLVQAAGCELIQGYLFWRALPVEEARALLGPAEAAGRLRKAS